MKGESIRSICGRTRNELIGNGDAILIYMTYDGALHSRYVSAGCIYVDFGDEKVLVIGYFNRPVKMETLRDFVIKKAERWEGCEYSEKI